MKAILGIDLSLNSPGVCLMVNGKSHYISILNLRKFSKKKDLTVDNYTNEAIELLSGMENVTFVPFVREPKSPKMLYEVAQRFSLENNRALMHTIANTIDSVLTIYKIDREELVVVTEGYSYGSNPNTLAEAAELGTYVRNWVCYDLLAGDLDRFFVISGPSIKKLAGKGNMDKHQMYEAWIARNKDEGDALLGFCKDNRDYFTKEKQKRVKKVMTTIKVMKTPLDDLVDAWWLCQYASSVLLADGNHTKKQEPRFQTL